MLCWLSRPYTFSLFGTHKLDVVAHAYKCSGWEVEAEELPQIQGRAGLQGETLLLGRKKREGWTDRGVDGRKKQPGFILADIQRPEKGKCSFSVGCKLF